MNRNTRRVVMMLDIPPTGKMQRSLQFVDEVGSYPDPDKLVEVVGKLLKGSTVRMSMVSTERHNGELFPGLKRGKYEVRHMLENRVCGHVHKNFWSALRCALRLNDGNGSWKVVNLKQRSK